MVLYHIKKTFHNKTSLLNKFLF